MASFDSLRKILASGILSGVDLERHIVTHTVQTVRK